MPPKPQSLQTGTSSLNKSRAKLATGRRLYKHVATSSPLCHHMEQRVSCTGGLVHRHQSHQRAFLQREGRNPSMGLKSARLEFCFYCEAMVTLESWDQKCFGQHVTSNFPCQEKRGNIGGLFRHQIQSIEVANMYNTGGAAASLSTRSDTGNGSTLQRVQNPHQPQNGSGDARKKGHRTDPASETRRVCSKQPAFKRGVKANTPKKHCWYSFNAAPGLATPDGGSSPAGLAEPGGEESPWRKLFKRGL